MPERTSYKPGTFSWADLATSDPDAAKRFYGQVFGWDAEDMPAGPDAVYTMCSLKGRYVAAIAAQRDEERSQGVPPHWQCYVTVDDVDAAADRARELGAQVLMPAFDVLEAGRMAVIQDPTAAVLMLWKPTGHIGAQLVNEPGALTWNDLYTRDVPTAQEFYRGLFGWRTDDIGGGYHVIWNGERTNGGMMAITENMGPMPPVWVPYFAAAAIGDTIDAVRGAGGELVSGPHEVPQGRFATLRDPQGAIFNVFDGHFDD